MPAQRIDFKHVREQADFQKVLEHFGIELEKDGTRPGQFRCLCPFHDDQKPSMKVNTERNIFNCFVCDDAHGNVIDFVMKLEGMDIRAAAKLVAELSGIGSSSEASAGNKRHSQAQRETSRRGGLDSERRNHTASIEEERNKPLSFELKDLVIDHPFLKERGITPDMIERFGLGIAKRGIMKDRLVFPIHNVDGELVAYCGRHLGDEPPDDVPKYKQPPNFRKELELFNWHRMKDRAADGEPVVLVESFLSVVKMFPEFPVVSPMGRSLSEHQIEILKEGGVSSIVVLFDGDDPGRTAVATVGRQLLGAGFKVTAPVVSEKFKPHKCISDELKSVLS